MARLPAHALALLLFVLAAGAADAAASCDSDAASGDSGMCAFPDASKDAGASTSAPLDKGASLELWGNPLSTCTRRVVLTLLEKGLTDFKFHHMNLVQQEQKDYEYMEHHQPFGKVPALSDGKLDLFESRAIARYIAEKYEGQGTPLLGSTLEERAMVNVWMEVESHEFNPQAGIVAYELVIGPRIRRIPNVTRAHEAAEKLEEVFNVYEERLEENDYLAGDFLSLADLNHMPYMAHLWPAGYSRLVEDRPNLRRWWREITSRASWLRIVEGFP